jgi:hypothetical protein
MFGLLHKNEIYNSYLTSVTVATLQLREGLLNQHVIIVDLKNLIENLLNI